MKIIHSCVQAHILFLFTDGLGHSDSQKDLMSASRTLHRHIPHPPPPPHNSKLLTSHDVLRQGVSKVWSIKTHREWKEQIPNTT